MTTRVVKAAGRKPPNAGKGRVKGVPNKVTASAKAMIEQALQKVGGVDYLARQAKLNPTAFMSLVGKLLPLQVNQTVRYDLSDLSDEELEALERIGARLQSVRPGEGREGETTH